MSGPREIITVDEVTALLKGCQARDQRTIGPGDTLAWWQDLNTARVGYADASAALSHYYANVWPRQDPRQRFRATAPVLIELVLAIRKQRLADSDFTYEPRHWEETGAQYVVRLRGQIAAVADGREPDQPAGHALLRKRPVAELIAGVAAARVLPPEIADVIARRRPQARSIDCPYCNAPRGANCKGPAGKDLSTGVHPGRIDSWAVAVAGCPTCFADPGKPCTENERPFPHGAHRGRADAAQNTPIEEKTP